MGHLFKSFAVAVSAWASISGAQAAVGDTVTYQFDTKATGGAVPTITQATLALTETASGVDFLLTPLWGPPTTGNSVDKLVFAYSGEALTYSFLSGPVLDSVSFSGSGAIDTSYSTTSVVELQWQPSGTNKFDSDWASSSWSLNGATISLADFGVFATSPSKPSPAFGVISMPGAVPSNWVALTPVPEPQAYAMAMLGMGLAVLVARRRRQQQS